MGDSTPFETIFNLPKPTCCSQGDCCKGASPSVPFYKLWEKAAQGDEFARGFLSLFVPYASHEEASKVVPGLVERSLKAALKNPDFKNEDDVVFYHCRYLQADNLCGVHEDRPQFCRDYPDSPFVVMAPGCAFEDWGQACKSKYLTMKEDLKTLKQVHQALEQGEGSAIGSLPEGWQNLGLTVAQEQNNLALFNQQEGAWLSLLSLSPLYLSHSLLGEANQIEETWFLLP